MPEEKTSYRNQTVLEGNLWSRWIRRDHPQQNMYWLTAIFIFGVLFGLMMVAYTYSFVESLQAYSTMGYDWIKPTFYFMIFVSALGAVGALLFVFFKRWGWILVMSFFMKLVIGGLSIIYRRMARAGEESDLLSPDYAPSMGPEAWIPITVMVSLSLIFLNLKVVKRVFKINGRIVLLGLSGGIILSVLQWLFETLMRMS